MAVREKGEIRREFLGYERPFLDHVAERWCAGLAPDADPSRTVFVLPGSRAARALEARIAARLDPLRPPPHALTEGGLAPALARETLRLASPLACTLAWRAALAELEPADRARLWRGAERSGAEASLARVAARAFAELCAHALEPAAVAEHLARTGRRDAARWRAFARAAERYRARLARDGRIDPADAARHVLAAGLLRADVELELVGCVDLPRSARALVDASPRGARAWIYAPEDQRDDFDAHGGLVVERWAERDVPLASERWHVADGPDEAARLAADELARLAPRLSPGEVSIGVLDREARPFLERRLAAAEVDPRWAAGRPLSATAVPRALDLVRRFLAERRFEDFRALLVHPDVEAAFERDLGGSLARIGSTLDEYARLAAPARLGAGFAPAAARADEVALARDALLAWLGELAGGAERPLARWADEIARLLADLFEEVDLGARDAAGWERARSFEALADLLAELRAAPSVACGAQAALELLLERVAASAVPPPPARLDRPAVELLGWLELALDGAPEALVLGFDEGQVPAPAPETAWLPERLRAELGIGHAARRVARDTWIALVLCRSRSTSWISTRQDLAGDPRVPSRLAFRAEREAVVERVARAFVDRSPPPPAVGDFAASPPLVLPHAAPRRLRVTAFKDYLASPYLFYLRHVLGLETVPARVLELDPLRFGGLAHAVLEAFGRSELAASTEADAILELLGERLELEVRRTLDPAAHAAVRLQVEQLRARFARFAAWQAETARAGWRIAAVEFEPRERITIAVDAGEVELAGRIDRIDFHAASGAWRVLDYKTSESRKRIGEARRRDGTWVDLQLPLYRRLARELVGGAPVELGYVSLDAEKDDELLALAQWTDADYADADAAARRVVEAVLAGRFEDVGERAPEDPILAALCGFGLAAEGEDEEAPA